MKKTHLKYILLTFVAILVLSISLHAGTGGLWLSLPTANASYNLSQSKLFPKILIYIQKNYVEPERINPKEMFKGALDRVQKNVPEILVEFRSPTSFTIIIDKAQKKFSSPLKSLSGFWKTMQEVPRYLQ